MTIKNYIQAPLPFTGQKRKFLKDFKQILQDNIPDDGQNWTIVDVFGGSGLLAHTAKRTKPQATVIYNDFDGYTDRLYQLDDTNRLHSIIKALIEDTPKEKRLSNDTKEIILNAIQDFDGYKDIDCLVSWLLFSGSQVKDFNDLANQNMYNNIRKSSYPNVKDYLDGLKIVSESYIDLLPKYINQDKTLLLLDPPYTCTEQGSYRKANYFGMVEFLRLMSMVRPPFIFFSSTRSEFLDYLELVLSERLDGWQRFANYKKISLNTNINYSAKYEDNMVFKF